MPGHKGRGEFLKFFPDSKIDVTELSYSDNLACPADVIKAAQSDIAKICGAKKSYILTDGSTCGVHTMIYAASKFGKKLIVSRNCHASVWNACRLLGIEPVVAQGETSDGILCPPDPQLVESLFLSDGDICGLIVTSPDYYGNIAPLAEYAAVAKKHKKLLLVDGAHGAHLCFEPERKGYAGVYADIYVDGAHKTLPTLTQGAALHINELSLVPAAEEGLALFRTTSPSYPIMASVEYGYKYLANNPQVLSRARSAAAAFDPSPVPLLHTDDWTKLVCDFAPLDLDADEIAAELDRSGIYSELSDGRRIIFYLSPAVTGEDLTALSNELKRIVESGKLKRKSCARREFPKNPKIYSYLAAGALPREYVPLNEAAGRVCAANCGVMPPCIPVIVAGERVTEQAIAALKGGGGVFGLTDGKIAVVKK